MKSRARQEPTAKATPGRTAVMYVRVSSKEQEQGFSIPAQRQLLKDYAERKGIHVVQEFEDVETAKRAGRTSFSEMVAFVAIRNTCSVATGRASGEVQDHERGQDDDGEHAEHLHPARCSVVGRNFKSRGSSHPGYLDR